MLLLAWSRACPEPQGTARNCMRPYMSVQWCRHAAGYSPLCWSELGAAGGGPMMVEAVWELVISYQTCYHGRNMSAGNRRGGKSTGGRDIWGSQTDPQESMHRSIHPLVRPAVAWSLLLAWNPDPVCYGEAAEGLFSPWNLIINDNSEVNFYHSMSDYRDMHGRGKCMGTRGVLWGDSGVC